MTSLIHADVSSVEGCENAHAETAYVNDGYPAGKGALLVGNFLSAFRGIPGVCEDFASKLEASGWPIFTTSNKPGRLTRLFDMVSTAWRKRGDYAVAHVEVYSGPAFSWAEAVCWTLRRAGKPYILTLHGGNLPVFSRRWPQRVCRLLRSAAAVTTPSRYLFEQMKPYRPDLRLLPNPLDLSNYHFRLRKQARSHLVWLRAFHEIYNPTLVPKVVALMAAEFPDIQVTMIGPDKGDGSLQRTRQEAAELGVSSRIILQGAVPKATVPGWMNKGEVFLNTTNVDNTPISVLEAMACGLCVVSTNVGGIPYLLEHEHDALLVPPDNSAAIAEAVRRILSEPGLAESLSRHARMKAELFDWSVILPQWESLLNSIAAG